MLVTDIKISYGTFTEYKVKYWHIQKKEAAYIHKNQSIHTPKCRIDGTSEPVWAYLWPV